MRQACPGSSRGCILTRLLAVTAQRFLMQRSTLTIDSAQAVQRLRSEVWRVGRRRYADVRVALSGLSGDDNARYSMQLRGLYMACGCNEGKLAGALATVGFALWAFTRPGSFAALSAIDFIFSAAVIALAALAGKFAALAAARRILGRSLDRLGMEADPS